MVTFTVLSEHACWGGVQGFYRHESSAIGLPMQFGVYQPPQARNSAAPALFYLAGLTCNEETFAIKAGAQQFAAEHGLVIVTPDTSPRNTGIEGADASWDFGTAAGFYLDAVKSPWDRHWKMETYVTVELPAVVAEHFPVQADRLGVFGHSMGGHGALTLALRHPGRYRSVSAFSPIAAPMRAPWHQGLHRLSRRRRGGVARARCNRADRTRRPHARLPGRPGHGGQIPFRAASYRGTGERLR